MNRRDLLSAVYAAVATGSAGRLSSLGRGDYEEIRLGLVTVSNRSDRDQTVDLLLRRDGETASRTRHDLRARDGDVIPGDRISCLLDEPAGAYAALARLERTGEAFDLPLVPNGHETRDVSLVVTEAGPSNCSARRGRPTRNAVETRRSWTRSPPERRPTDLS